MTTGSRTRLLQWTVVLILGSGLWVMALPRGARPDYERAVRFLPWNIRKLVADADVAPTDCVKQLLAQKENCPAPRELLCQIPSRGRASKDFQIAEAPLGEGD